MLDELGWGRKKKKAVADCFKALLLNLFGTKKERKLDVGQPRIESGTVKMHKLRLPLEFSCSCL
jgi:hypothetical protein